LAPKAIRIHSPFLLVFTQQATESRRSKRSIDSYYQYLPVDESNEQQTQQKDSSTNSDLDSNAVWRNNFEKFRETGPRLLKERPPVRINMTYLSN
jgi:hypothetical protein